MRPDDEEAGEEKQHQQPDHDDLDDGEAAAESIGESLGSGILAFQRRRSRLGVTVIMRMIMVVLVMRMIVCVAHGGVTSFQRPASVI